MNKHVIFSALVACQFAVNVSLLGQGTASPAPNPLVEVMTEIQAKTNQHSSENPDEFKKIGAAIADQHLTKIIQAATSQIPKERRLAAFLLAFATPSNDRTDTLIALASDEVPDVRYAALGGLAAVTDGTNKAANDAIIRALRESGNHGLTRDAAYAASTLKLEEALPLLKVLLESEDSLNKRYAAEAAARYGRTATMLLPALQDGITTTNDPELKAIMERALISINLAGDIRSDQSGLSPSPNQLQMGTTNEIQLEAPSATTHFISTQVDKRNSVWRGDIMLAILVGGILLAVIFRMRLRSSDSR